MIEKFLELEYTISYRVLEDGQFYSIKTLYKLLKLRDHINESKIMEQEKILLEIGYKS